MKPRRVTVLLKPELYALAEGLARDAGKNISALIRSLIAEKLRERGVYYDPALLKMPQGERTDLNSAEARAAFARKVRPQLERARAGKAAKRNLRQDARAT